jgi:hypothetical protein
MLTRLNSKSRMAIPIKRESQKQEPRGTDLMDHGTVPLAPSEHDGVDVSPLDRVSAVPCPHCLFGDCRHAGPTKGCRMALFWKSSSLARRQPSSALIESSHDEGCLLGGFYQQELVTGVPGCRRPIPRAQIVIDRCRVCFANLC